MELDLDVNWDKISRAADGMILNYGEDALTEAKKRADTMKVARRYTAATTWDSIYKTIKDRTAP